MGNIGYQHLKFLTFFLYLAPILLHNRIQPKEAITDAGKDSFCVTNLHRFFTIVDHTVHRLTQTFCKQRKPFGKKTCEKE